MKRCSRYARIWPTLTPASLISNLSWRPLTATSDSFSPGFWKAVAESNPTIPNYRTGRAIALGYRGPVTFRTETALDPLRSRDEFRLMMMDLVMPSAPFGAER